MKIKSLSGIDDASAQAFVLQDKEDILLIDYGINLTQIINLQEIVKENEKIDYQTAKNYNAIASLDDINFKNIKGIVLSHAHLDHIGGLKYLPLELKHIPIYATRFTCAVLDEMGIENPKHIVEYTSPILISTFKVEFIEASHSTINSALIYIENESKKSILYAQDFKIDNRPLLGERTNIERLNELKGVNTLIMDSLGSNVMKKTQSECVVKEQLRDVFIETQHQNTQLIVASTYASHIARIKSLVQLAKEIHREVIFIGRSLNRYSNAARKSQYVNFEQLGVTICRNHYDLKKIQKKIMENKSKYLIICTGHQGEEKATLKKIATNTYPIKLGKDDLVLLSSHIIPVEQAQMQGEELNKDLEQIGCKVYRDLHVSGHGTYQDVKYLIELTAPKYILPSHGNMKLKEGAKKAAEKLGYITNKNLLFLSQKEELSI